MATMQDVARQARVSLSTVSYVLSGARPVSQATRDRVHQAMKALDFRPNALARGLASKKTRILALVYSPAERGIGLTEIEFVTHAAEAASLHNYHLVLWSIESQDAGGLENLLGQNLIDGAILMEVLMEDPRVALLNQRQIPFSIIGRTRNDSQGNWVDIDIEATTRHSVAHLADLGHRRLLFFNQSEAVFNSGYGPSVRVWHTLLETCQTAGIECRMGFCPPKPHEGYLQTLALLDSFPASCGIVMNDRIIPGILRALEERNLQIPGDFSLVSLFSSPRVSEMFNPAICTWAVESAAMARLAVEQLIGTLSGHDGNESRTLVPCTFYPGASTAQAPHRSP